MKKGLFLVLVSIFSFTFVKAFSFDIQKLDFQKEPIVLPTSYAIDIDDFTKEEENHGEIKSLAKEIFSLSFKKDAKNQLSNYMFVNTSNGFETINASIFISAYLDELSTYSISYDYIKIIRVVSFSEGDLAFLYLDDVQVNDSIQDVIFVYWFKDQKLFYPRIVIEEDLEAYFDSVIEEEDAGRINGGSYKGLSLLKNEDVVDDAFLSSFFVQHVHSNVQITGLKQDGISSYGSGFLISSGVVVTSWTLLLEMLQKQAYIYVSDADGQAYKISGVISLQVDYDVVVLKLDRETKQAVTFGDSLSLEVDDSLFLINSNNNHYYSIRYGSFVTEEKGRLHNLFALNKNDVGSALYNKDGLVVGMNTTTILYSEQSIANSTNYLVALQNTLNEVGYANIESTSLDLFFTFYYYPLKEEEKRLSISMEELYLLQGIGDLQTISLPLVKASKEDGILSLRYKNTIGYSMDTLYLAALYEESLVREGYTKQYSSLHKKIYRNDKYRIILKENMNYFVLLIMER